MAIKVKKFKRLPMYGIMGEELQIEHLKAYVVKPGIATDQAVIVIHDDYGWQSVDIRLKTDMMCLAGYIGVCPDFFDGKEPWDPAGDMVSFQDWQQDKKPDAVLNEVNVVLKFLKEECGAKHIGLLGFFWGGEAAHHIALQYPEIKATVSFYGIAQLNEDNYKLKCPTLFIFAERDSEIPIEQVSSFEANLREKCPVDFKVKIFPEQTHGFAHYRLKDIKIFDKISINEARIDMIHWLKKYMMIRPSIKLPRYGEMGEVVEIEHLKAYLVKPDIATDQAVIVIHDALGWQTVFNRYRTDKMCLAGYIAICPDFFVGKKAWDVDDGQLYHDWQRDKTPDTVLNEMNVVLKYLKEQCGAKSIGAVGYCWGGEAVYHIALWFQEIKAAVSFYGMAKNIEDNYELKCPTLFIFEETDPLIHVEQVNSFKSKLRKSCPINFQVEIFPERRHRLVHTYPFQEGRESMFPWLEKYMMPACQLETVRRDPATTHTASVQNSSEILTAIALQGADRLL